MIVSKTTLPRGVFRILLAQWILTPFALGQGVTWEPGLDAALVRAKSEGRVVMVAMNMDDERESDRMLKEHYADPVIVSLMQQMVNVFCSDADHKKTGTCPHCQQNACSSHRNNSFNVRRKFFGQEGHNLVRAPQHLFLTPDGKIYSSAIGGLAVGELEWMIREAMRSTEQHKDLAEAGGERSHAPTSYKRGVVDVEAKPLKPAPDKKQLAEALAQAKSSSGRSNRSGRRGRRGRGSTTPSWVEVLIRVEDRKARSAVGKYLKSSRDSRAGTLFQIGQRSPVSWQKIVSEWLPSDSESARRSAIVALMLLRDPKSLSILKKGYRKEKVEELQGRFLRALAAVGPTDSAVVSAVVKAATKHKIELVRAHAMVAAGKLELRQPILACLQAGLQDSSMVVRSVTAYVIAERQYRELADALTKSLEAETEDAAKEWMQKAAAALTSRDPKEFDEFLRQTIDKPAGRRDRRNRDEGGEDGSGRRGRDGGEADGTGRRRRG